MGEDKKIFLTFLSLVVIVIVVGGGNNNVSCYWRFKKKKKTHLILYITHLILF